MDKIKRSNGELKIIRKELKQMILAYCAMWSAIFSTISAITISILVGIRHADTFVQATETTINLIAVVLKLYSIFA